MNERMKMVYALYDEGKTREEISKILNEDKRYIKLVLAPKFMEDQKRITQNQKEKEKREKAVCELIKVKNNFSEVAKELNLSVGSNTYLEFKKIAKKYGLDTTHFNRKRKSNQHKNSLKEEDIFKKESLISSSRISGYLFKFGIKEMVCERCGRVEWEGEPIPLQVHHIDGDRTNNSIENLQILCPNCHALTDNYCGKNAKKRTAKEIIKEAEENLSKKICKERAKEKKITEQLETIKNSGIDFQKWGWVKKAGELVGMTQLHVREFLMKNDPDFYATCYTKEKAIEAAKRRKDSQIKKKEEDKEKIINRKKIIVEAGIDTSERGWLTKLSKSTGINRQTLMDFIKKYMPEMLKTVGESSNLSTPAT